LIGSNLSDVDGESGVQTSPVRVLNEVFLVNQEVDRRFDEMTLDLGKQLFDSGKGDIRVGDATRLGGWDDVRLQNAVGEHTSSIDNVYVRSDLVCVPVADDIGGNGFEDLGVYRSILLGGSVPSDQEVIREGIHDDLVFSEPCFVFVGDRNGAHERSNGVVP
jgi:hypothetical protein